jgi:hypothetical protein
MAQDIPEKLYHHDFTRQNIKEIALPSLHAPPFLAWDKDSEALMVLQAYASREGSDFFLYKIINN